MEPTSLHVWRTSANLLMNYVRLDAGIPKRLHFTDDYLVERAIADKETGKIKRAKSLVFWVDREEGEDVAKSFSVLSEKLAAHLQPFLKDKEYTKYDFIITKMGDGFYTDFNVQPILKPE